MYTFTSQYGLQCTNSSGNYSGWSGGGGGSGGGYVHTCQIPIRYTVIIIIKRMFFHILTRNDIQPLRWCLAHPMMPR